MNNPNHHITHRTLRFTLDYDTYRVRALHRPTQTLVSTVLEELTPIAIEEAKQELVKILRDRLAASPTH